MIVHNPEPGTYEQLTLRCECGTGINGAVLAGKTSAAVALFVAHHAGPECSTTWTTAPMAANAGSNATLPRITPERICGSAWWVKDPNIPGRWVIRKPEGWVDRPPPLTNRVGWSGRR